MNLITRLEKSKEYWFLLIASLVFFLLRLPSLIEPNWYGDEGIYQTIGIALSQGRILYSQIWDNKPPLLYVVYSLFHGDQFSIRLLSLLSGIATFIIYFFLTKALFNRAKMRYLVPGIFALLFATPILEGNIANAENFMLPFIILAGFLIFQSTMQKSAISLPKQFTMHHALLVSGLLLGIAFLFKTVAFFDLTAFAFFLLLTNKSKFSLNEKLSKAGYFKLKNDIKWFLLWVFSGLKTNALLFVGFLLPFLFTVGIFSLNHSLADYFQAVFLSNVDYIGYNNKILFPQDLLTFKIVLLIVALSIIIWQKKRESIQEKFIFSWFIFATFDVFFSQRPFTHYLLLLLPSFCLMIGLLVDKISKREKILLLLSLLTIFALIIINFTMFPLALFVGYYQNVLLYLTGKESTTAYRAFFDPKTPRDYEIAAFIKNHTIKTDNIFIWGDNAQIYTLTDKLPPGRYTVAYHIRQNENAFPETQIALLKIRPKYVITLAEAPPIPFSLPEYSAILNLKGGIIYEKAY